MIISAFPLNNDSPFVILHLSIFLQLPSPGLDKESLTRYARLSYGLHWEQQGSGDIKPTQDDKLGFETCGTSPSFCAVGDG